MFLSEDVPATSSYICVSDVLTTYRALLSEARTHTHTILIKQSLPRTISQQSTLQKSAHTCGVRSDEGRIEANHGGKWRFLVRVPASAQRAWRTAQDQAVVRTSLEEHQQVWEQYSLDVWNTHTHKVKMDTIYPFTRQRDKIPQTKHSHSDTASTDLPYSSMCM